MTRGAAGRGGRGIGRWSARLCALALAASPAACGGGGGGVDREKALAELSVHEIDLVCGGFAALFSQHDAVRFECYLDALATGVSSQQCEQFVEICVEQMQPVAFGCLIDIRDTVENLACAGAITVGQWEDCLDSYAENYGDLAKSVTCESSLDLVEQDILPAECTVLEAGCPDLFGGSGAGSILPRR